MDLDDETASDSTPPSKPVLKQKRNQAQPKRPSNRAPPKQFTIAPKEVFAKAKPVTKRRSVPNPQPRGQVSKKLEVTAEFTRPPTKRASRSNRIAVANADLKSKLALLEAERQASLEAARRNFESMAEQKHRLSETLNQVDIDIRKLKDEKWALLDELIVCEGLAVNPYPPFLPNARV